MCSSGHPYESRVFVVVNATRYRGCPYCSGKKVLVGFNDLATTHPELAQEAYGWDPSTVTRNHRTHKNWKCTVCNEVWFVMPNGRKGCPYCAGNKVRVGVTDLYTKFPEIAKQADGWDAKTVSAFSGLRKKWICSEGHRWACSVGNRTNLGSGCPTCNGHHGYLSSLEGYLYLVVHEERGMQKIGVSNVPEHRLNTHRINGWKLIERIGPLDGILVYNYEQKILKELRVQGVICSMSDADERFDGYTESWPIEKLEVMSIDELIGMIS